MFRIIAIGAVLAASMIAIKDRHILERTHVVGSCATIVQKADGSEWRSCVPGRLTGRPGLEFVGCTDYGRYRTAEYWNCPAGLAPDTLRQ